MHVWFVNFVVLFMVTSAAKQNTKTLTLTPKKSQPLLLQAPYFLASSFSSFSALIMVERTAQVKSSRVVSYDVADKLAAIFRAQLPIVATGYPGDMAVAVANVSNSAAHDHLIYPLGGVRNRCLEISKAHVWSKAIQPLLQQASTCGSSGATPLLYLN